MAWAINQKLPTHDKFILLMMANYASNDRGDCFPSVNRLMDDTALSKDSVLRAIKAIEARGLITVTRRMQDGVNLPNVYRMHLEITTNPVNGGVVADSYHPSLTAGGVVADSDSNQSFNLSIKKKEKAGAKIGITFNFDDGIFIDLKCDQKDSWQAAYPATNVDAEILKAAVWLKANPSNRKSNYARFLTNWLNRAQDNAPRTTTGVTRNANRFERPRTVHDERADFFAGMRDLTNQHLDGGPLNH